MKVVVNIPEGLYKNIEFIPEAMLEEVLISALEDKIYKSNLSVDNDSQEILSMLKAMMTEGIGFAKVESVPVKEAEVSELVKTENVVEFVKPKELIFDNVERIQSIEENDSEDLDDMDDLMYLMK